MAETLLNPFGDDDEDFEINYLIDRNVQVSKIFYNLLKIDICNLSGSLWPRQPPMDLRFDHGKGYLIAKCVK